MKKKLLSFALIISMLTAILIPTSHAASPTLDDIIEKASEIICSKEGTYSSVVADDNGALSIGCLQWHGNRALNLLKDIIKANTPSAKAILSEELYTEITTASSWSTRILTSEEKNLISKLLDTSEGRAEQDELLYLDVMSYVKHGQALGITAPDALVYFADVENQCGPGKSDGSNGASRVAKSAVALAGEKPISLAILHQAALEDPSAGKYSSRRNSVYDYCVLLDWEEDTIAEAYEVWITAPGENTTLNVRSGPGTGYEKISQYSHGVSVIIYEQVTAGDMLWGRTSIGWICLDYCEFVSRHDPAEGTFSVTFDAAGGNVDSTPKATAKITGINTHRSTNALIIFTREYGETTNTNSYGAEFTVSSAGYAQTSPSSSANNSKIPAGGFVVSAHGDSISAITGKFKKDDYVDYDTSEMTLSAYRNYQSYIASNKKAKNGAAISTLPTVTREGYIFEGWFDKNGTKYTKDTVVTHTEAFTLTAKWTPVTATVTFESNTDISEMVKTSVKATGINIYRFENYFVVYDNNRGATSLTNKYGAEAAIGANGVVTQLWPEGTGDHPIPTGGYIISGHGTMSKWITSNVKVGDKVKFDRSTLTFSVLTEGAQVFDPIKTTYGTAIGKLPIPTREGYTFLGWETEDGTAVTSETLSFFTNDTTLYGKWQSNTSEDDPGEVPDDKPTHIKGDINEDGKVNARDKACITEQIKSPDSVSYTYADVNEDGKINARDKAEITAIIKSAS